MAGSYTEDFNETWFLADTIDPAANQGVLGTNWVYAGNYHRAIGMLFTGALNATVDLRFWQAQDLAGTGAKIVGGTAITQLAATDDNSKCLIELQTEELDADNGFGWIRLILTNGGGAGTANNSCVALFLGIPRFAPPGTANWDEVVT